jgi:hypothetical protein
MVNIIVIPLQRGGRENVDRISIKEVCLSKYKTTEKVQVLEELSIYKS